MAAPPQPQLSSNELKQLIEMAGNVQIDTNLTSRNVMIAVIKSDDTRRHYRGVLGTYHRFLEVLVEETRKRCSQEQKKEETEEPKEYLGFF